VADFEIIEADFQQFYTLDVTTIGFRRYARLLVNLPPESRFVQKCSPFKDWSWDKEVQTQILHAIDMFSAMYANAHRKKGSQPIKAPEVVQPDYVIEAKKKAKEAKREQNGVEQKELAELFNKRNNKVKDIEGKIDGS